MKYLAAEPWRVAENLFPSVFLQVMLWRVPVGTAASHLTRIGPAPQTQRQDRGRAKKPKPDGVL